MAVLAASLTHRLGWLSAAAPSATVPAVLVPVGRYTTLVPYEVAPGVIVMAPENAPVMPVVE